MLMVRSMVQLTGGGIRSKRLCRYGCGTVFSFDPTTGTEAVLYSFTGTADGEYPSGGLVLLNGILYGTTTYAGSGSYCVEGYPCGTAFSIDPATNAETTLYSFCNQPNCADGSSPNGDLLDVNGTLYGTAAY